MNSSLIQDSPRFNWINIDRDTKTWIFDFRIYSEIEQLWNRPTQLMPKSFSMMMVFAPNRCFSMCNIFRLYIFKKFKYYINLCLNNWFFMSIHHMKSFLRLIDLRIAIGRLYLLASEYHKGNCKEYMSWDQMKYIKISYSLSSETSSSKLNPNHILPCIYIAWAPSGLGATLLGVCKLLYFDVV